MLRTSIGHHRLILLASFVLVAGVGRAAEPPPPVLDEARPGIAITDLAASGVPPDLAATITGIVAAELQHLGVFSVITTQDLRAIVAQESLQQLSGCEGAQCTARAGTSLGTRYLLGGSVSRTNGTVSLSLALNDLTLGTVIGRASTDIADPGHLREEAVKAARKVVAALLAGRQGTLVVTSSEQGAVVKIDGDVVGTTPLPRRSINWGPHEIQVVKEGFVTGLEEISVGANETVERYFALIPSDDFLKKYEANARGLRTGAWVATALAVAALGGATYFQIDHIRRADAFATQLQRYDSLPSPTSAQWNQLAQMHTAAENSIHWTYGLGAAGLALGLGAVAFWVVGPDPGRYARYPHAEPGSTPPPSPPVGSVSFQLASPAGLVATSVVLP